MSCIYGVWPAGPSNRRSRIRFRTEPGSSWPGMGWVGSSARTVLLFLIMRMLSICSQHPMTGRRLRYGSEKVDRFAFARGREAKTKSGWSYLMTTRQVRWKHRRAVDLDRGRRRPDSNGTGHEAKETLPSSCAMHTRSLQSPGVSSTATLPLEPPSRWGSRFEALTVRPSFPGTALCSARKAPMSWFWTQSTRPRAFPSDSA